VLLANVPDWDSAPSRIDDSRAKYFFSHKYAFGMMPQSAMTKVRHVRFAAVKPVMNWLVIFYAAAPLLYRRQGVVIWVRHDLVFAFSAFSAF
jgi:hypothetical protein